MKYNKHLHRRKIKRYRKINTHEYAVIFDNSNSLIDFVCNIKTKIIGSSLYVYCGQYQLLIFTDSALYFGKNKNAVFCDRLHIDEIKHKSRLICKDNAIQKMQKAFKDF